MRSDARPASRPAQASRARTSASPATKMSSAKPSRCVSRSRASPIATPASHQPGRTKMPIRSDATHWGSLAKFFHWTIVLLILAQGILGLVMVELPRKPDVVAVYTFHKSLGLTILALALLRLGWRLFDRRPLDPPTMPHWQGIAARLGHALLYVLLFAVPLSGWLFDSATGL